MELMLKIIRINAYIQRKMGKVLLDGKEVICVALDNTCAVEGEDNPEIELTSEQLQGLFSQTFGFLKTEVEDKV
jgi:hypothetical protein